MYTTGTSASPCPTPIHLPSFLSNLSRKQAKLFDGVRCDSGDEFRFIDRLTARYKELGIDSTTKTIVFSNALDFDKALDIQEYCRGKIRCSFGIGTNLTNDTGFKPSNIVMKLSQCKMNLNQEWRECVKLSDDIGNISAARKRYVPVYTICGWNKLQPQIHFIITML